MLKTYTHEIVKEVESISGWYRLEREEKLELGGKTYLYLIGIGVVDSSCCGMGGCRYAIVPGSIVNWKSGKNQEGLDLTSVEPVHDDKIRKELSAILSEKEKVSQVQFW